ncbi:hypothetical protein C8J56DRAFT_879991 [Mycena floridula]|nr:hypothetical protein C8J56DRAFT_879991 [Mycena floridula]
MRCSPRGLIIGYSRSAAWSKGYRKLVYKDWELWTDPPPDVETVTFYNQKLGYHSYNPPEGYTAKEIMRFRRAKKHLKTVEAAQKLIDSMELEGTLGWNLEDFYLQFRDGPGPHDIKRKSTEPVE